MSSDEPSSNDVYNIDISKGLGNVRVITKGLSRIKPSAISHEISRVKDAENVEELFLLLDDTHQRLEKLSLFKSTESFVTRGLNEGDVDVIFTFEEKSALFTVGANVNSKAEAGVEIKGELPGVLGSVNTLTVNANTTGGSNNEFSGSFYIPRISALPNFTGLFQLFTSHTDLNAYSSYSTRSKGLRFTLSNLNFRHRFIWEASVRDVYPTFNEQFKASEAILKNSGCSLKNSLSYTYSLDNLSGDAIPFDGELTKFRIESGIPGGDCQFLKFDYSMLLARFIKEKFIGHLSMSVGYLHPLGSYSPTSSILDRFHFTGASGTSSTFRGFRFHGVGPHDWGGLYNVEKGEWFKKADHLGGDYFGNIQMSLYYPFNLSNFQSPMAFGFCNIGTLSSLKPGIDLYAQALKDIRLSVGTGLSMNLSSGCWVEAFVSKALLYAPSDILSPFQVGLRFKSGG
ncbi:conserved hypothetical protein [Theileria equi strain WA]|uniref:Bacterial surface antigen (D15) domain-containing protein n=1 Tax=Theileria equi strain WA TaxID=1537102 RepID=L1LCG4_THEEQ|nr:conserved hypothetical protein [Theileria equi strain WA]EKX73132.1 conserved hypothetical protein [Theileria equi strain WA]|eukprot:XP_004832584.1 conserved hypothetical protein [Theileria equi strain WA]